MRKVIVVLAAIGMLAFIVAPASAETIKLSGRHNAGEIGKACRANGGQFFNRGVDGYECFGKKGYVQCKPNGECTGSCSNCKNSAASAGGGRAGDVLANAPAKTQPLQAQQATSKQKVTRSPTSASKQPLTQQTVGSSNSKSKETMNASSSSRRNSR